MAKQIRIEGNHISVKPDYRKMTHDELQAYLRMKACGSGKTKNRKGYIKNRDRRKINVRKQLEV